MILPKHFSSQTKKTKEIYDKYMIKRTFPYLILTDTGSICAFFIFICKPESYMPYSQLRDVLFEVVVNNDVLHRFDTSHRFWEKYSVRNESLRKKTWLFCNRKY